MVELSLREISFTPSNDMEIVPNAIFLAQDTKIFVAGEHSFSLFQEENIPWSICVLLTSH